jgi:hypothetical protein
MERAILPRCSTAKSLLGGVNCTLRKYTCSGIKVCSKTSPDLRNFCHDEVTDSIQLALEITRKDITEARTANNNLDYEHNHGLGSGVTSAILNTLFTDRRYHKPVKLPRSSG